MSITRDSSGRRSIEVEVEVPGTPEEVWEAIATGPGISSWFFPTEVGEREGGAVRCHLGPGMDSLATVTTWDPPRRFAAEAKGADPDAPAIASEWTVEPRAGGKCIVRIVHSLFASSDDWDDQLESAENGWPCFFAILRLYLARFRGQPASIVRLLGSAAGSADEVWRTLLDGLGVAGLSEGQPWNGAAFGAPAAGGVLERLRPGVQPYAVLRLDRPLGGIAAANAFPMGGQAMANVGIYLYGGDAAAVAARDEAAWQAWMKERFP